MVVEQIEDLERIEKELVSEPKRKKSFLSDRAVKCRQKQPTQFTNGIIQIRSRVASVRRTETYQAAVEIHGGSLNSPSNSCRAAGIGLIDTVVSRCSRDKLVEVLATSRAITKHVMPKIYKPDLKKYECSEDNMLRSIALCYGGGIMGGKSIVKFIGTSHTGELS